jgi:hypothetical protein
MNQFEQNVIASFSLAKTDITELYKHVRFILNKLEELKKENTELKSKVSALSKKPKRKVTVKTNKKAAGKVIRVKKKIVSSKSSKKVHDSKCPFAQNIKPKNKLVFSSKVKALNDGYKLCKCLN